MITAMIIRTEKGASGAPVARLRRITRPLLLSLTGLALAAVYGCAGTAAAPKATGTLPAAAASSAPANPGGQGGDATNGQGGDVEPQTGHLSCDLLRGAGLGIHGVKPAGDPNQPDPVSQGCNLFTDQGTITVTLFHGHQSPRIQDTPGIVLMPGGKVPLYDYNGSGQTGFFVRPAPEPGQDYIVTVFLISKSDPGLLRLLLMKAYDNLASAA
jgi:hypothetical protein